MKPQFLLGLALSGGLFAGCHGIGTQRFTAFTPSQSHELETSSRIVLDVIPKIKMTKADYNLRENLSMLAPMPKHWKADVTLSWRFISPLFLSGIEAGRGQSQRDIPRPV